MNKIEFTNLNKSTDIDVNCEIQFINRKGEKLYLKLIDKDNAEMELACDCQHVANIKNPKLVAVINSIQLHYLEF